MSEMNTPQHERARGEGGAAGLDLKVRFVLPAPTAEVVGRLGEAVEGTQLELVRLEGDGVLCHPPGKGASRAEAARWDAVLSAPTGTVTSHDVERFLARARASLPIRCSVVLSGGRHPSYAEAAVGPPTP